LLTWFHSCICTYNVYYRIYIYLHIEKIKL